VTRCWLCILWFFCTSFSIDAWAETLGLRFIVDRSLGQTESQQQTVRARLTSNVAEMNGFFTNSAINLAAEIVQVEFARIENIDALAILEGMSHERGGFEHLFAEADEYGADYTFAIVGKLMLRGKRGCGRAYAVNQTVAEISSSRRALAVIDIACGAHTMAHELGHLMGLNHGEMVDTCQPGMGHKTAIAPYANGYAEGGCDGKPGSGKFGTIMVGGWMKAINGDGHSSLRLFSNPRIRDTRCGSSGICGSPQTGDAARTLNENATYYATHEEPDVHVLPYGSKALAHCILQKYKGHEIKELEELDCSNTAVDRLDGVEYLTSLKRIYLKNNHITDFSPLGKLSSDTVELLDLSKNALASCPSVAVLIHKFGNKVTPPSHCIDPSNNPQEPEDTPNL